MLKKDKIKNKTCFVIMGFGKKMDYKNAKEIDLDIIYHDVIQKVFQKHFPDYMLIRADEVAGSYMIDVSMYALIMKADLVIADITTMNLNVIYELGIRHALKPFSTIIMMQKDYKELIPFDLHHCRILMYGGYKDKLPEKEADKIKSELEKYIRWTGTTDSPMYTILPEKDRPDNIDKEYKRVIQKFREEEAKDNVRMLYENAKIQMAASNFKEAENIWKKLHEKLPGDSYIVQQQALAQYKSKLPSEGEALENALHTLESLHPEYSLDLETLGITGAIYKRKFKLYHNFDDLDKAIYYYHKGYLIKNDYYNGENYAICILEKINKDGLEKDEINSLKYIAKNIFKDLIKTLQKLVTEVPEENYWMYATLSTSYYYIGDIDKYTYFRNIFYDKTQSDWERQTYEEQLCRLKNLLSISI